MSDLYYFTVKSKEGNEYSFYAFIKNSKQIKNGQLELLLASAVVKNEN